MTGGVPVPDDPPLRPTPGSAERASPSDRARWRRRRAWGLVVLLLLVVVPTWVFGYFPGVSGPPIVQVREYCGGNLDPLEFEYSGPERGFLFREYNESAQYCTSTSVPPRSTYETTLAIHSADTLARHTVLSVAISGPYSLAGSSPSLPTEIPPGGNLSIELTIRVPSLPGSYGLPGATVVAA
ncbi:MAG TPA: hypothetical protein VMH90_04915 [Thermoplasmata archaeon]|nr:hypothetical protein [Thermoplasmata archaeon]